jgi:FKBP-type peptidyl-prolyl cis-trans isomerase FkpA
MAEVTRVPIQPIAKGSLTKLWLGVVVAVLLGAGIAWAAVPAGVSVEELQVGTGANPGDTDVLFTKYTGKLADGTVFDEWSPPPIPVDGIFPEGSPLFMQNIVPGFREAAAKMQKGGKYLIEIPAEKAYGDEPPPNSGIQPGADLIFEVELVDFMSEQDFQQRLAVLQQMMQMQQGPEGQAPGGPAPGGQAPAPQGPPPPQ